MSEGKTLRERLEADVRFSLSEIEGGLRVHSAVNGVTYTVDTYTMEVDFEHLYKGWIVHDDGDASPHGWTALYGVLKANGSRVPNLALVTE